MSRLHILFRRSHCLSLKTVKRLPQCFNVSLEVTQRGALSSHATLSRLARPAWNPAHSYWFPGCTLGAQVRRNCSLSENDIKRRIDEITELFSDARELVEDAVSRNIDIIA